MPFKLRFVFGSFLFLGLFLACSQEEKQFPPPTSLVITAPENFPSFPAFPNNPITKEGVALGKKLFYDPVLSRDQTISCASCHKPANGFSDPNAKSIGIDGQIGKRNAMPLFNLAWVPYFFWEGRAVTLEQQILEPVPNPIEMDLAWPLAIIRLKESDAYNLMFGEAFQTLDYDSTHVAKAIAQFLRTIISGNSKFDKVKRGEAVFTPSELNGFDIFATEKGDCFHCHNAGTPFLTDFSFKNNGLDLESEMDDPGRMQVTGNPSDRAKFKTPTLRNIALTAPFMHDGRFATIMDVIDHYNSGGKPSSTVDPLMKNVGTGLNLTMQEKQDLLAFLLTLTDSTLLSNPAYLP